MDSNDVRKIVLCPSVVNGMKVDEMFTKCSSPVSIEVHCSCVFDYLICGKMI